MHSTPPKRILLLSTDTQHHRYYINRLIDDGIPLEQCVFEATSPQAPFAVGPVFEADEAAFETANFFKDVRRDLDRVEVHLVSDITGPEGIGAIRATRPDLGVVFGTRRLPMEVIALFPDGLINMHRGIATRYRGLDSDLWAVYHKDWANIGATVHMVDAGLDTGPILASESLDLSPGMACHQLRYHTTKIVTRLTARVLKNYLADRMEGVVQERTGRYYSFMPLDLKRIVARRFDRHCNSLATG